MAFNGVAHDTATAAGKLYCSVVIRQGKVWMRALTGTPSIEEADAQGKDFLQNLHLPPMRW